MSGTWIVVIALIVTTAIIRASGPVLLGGRELPRPVARVVALLAPALLAALVVVQTFGAPEGGELEVDERVLGVAVAGIVLWRGGSALPASLLGAAATALARLPG